MCRKVMTSGRDVAVAMLILQSVFVGVVAVRADDDETYARVLAESYLANRDSFDNVDSQFIVSIGFASNVDDAVKRGPARDVTRATGVWVVNQGVERYELDRDLRKGRSPIESEGKIGVVLPPVKLLAGPEHGLRYSGILSSATVGDRIAMATDFDFTVWNMAGLTQDEENCFGPFLLAVLEHRTGSVQIEKRARGELTKVEIQTDGDFRRYYVDEKRGCLPMEIYMGDNKDEFRWTVVTTAVKQCSRGRWYPTRVVYTTVMDRGGVCVNEVKVTTLDVDTPVATDKMRVSLPKNTSVNDPTEAGHQFRMASAESVGYGDFPTLIQRGQEAKQRQMEIEAGAAPPLAPSVEATGWGGWLIIANLVCGGAILVVYALRSGWHWNRTK